MMIPCIMICGCIKEAAMVQYSCKLRGSFEARPRDTTMATVWFLSKLSKLQISCAVGFCGWTGKLYYQEQLVGCHDDDIQLHCILSFCSSAHTLWKYNAFSIVHRKWRSGRWAHPLGREECILHWTIINVYVLYMQYPTFVFRQVILLQHIKCPEYFRMSEWRWMLPKHKFGCCLTHLQTGVRSINGQGESEAY